MMKAGLRFTCLLFLAVSLFPTVTRGDGAAFQGHDLSSLEPIQEREQMAAIVHHNNMERMIIAINFEAEDQDNALWIFPLPSTPGKTRLEVLNSFPLFFGNDPRQTASAVINGLMTVSRATQIYPLPFELMSLTFGTSDGVPVHAEVEKWGVHAEAITTRSMDDLTAYLQERRAGISKEHLRTFEPYLSDQYVLVISWIASREQLLKEFPKDQASKSPGRGRWPCLYVEFPADQIFYPLRPTSTYGHQEIPVRLYVLGYVKPEVNPSLARQLDISYYRQPHFLENTPKEFIESLPSRNIPYTRVSIETRAENFIDDLWFSPIEPSGMRYAEVVERLGEERVLIPIGIIFVAVISYISAGLSALILFGRWGKYARLGLWNMLTWVGLIIATSHYFVRERKMNPHIMRTTGQETGFWLLFTIIFILITVVLQILLRLPLQK